jgi:hypothetical protein
VDAIRPSIELGGRNEAEAEVVVPILRRIVVAVRDAAVLRVVVPGAAANNAVRALWRLTFEPQKYALAQIFCICMGGKSD